MRDEACRWDISIWLGGPWCAVGGAIFLVVLRQRGVATMIHSYTVPLAL
jgi:hypothetical protein